MKELDDPIQIIGTIGQLYNYMDGSYRAQIIISSKYLEQVFQLAKLQNQEAVINIYAAKNVKIALSLQEEPEQSSGPEPEDPMEEAENEMVKVLRSAIYKKIMNAGKATERRIIYQKITGKDRLSDCTIKELQTIDHFLNAHVEGNDYYKLNKVLEKMIERG